MHETAGIRMTREGANVAILKGACATWYQSEIWENHRSAGASSGPLSAPSSAASLTVAIRWARS